VSALTIVVVRWSISTCVAHGHCTYLRWGSLAWFNQAYPSPYGQVSLAGLHSMSLTHSVTQRPRLRPEESHISHGLPPLTLPL
jgi:hypothetical protein